MFLGAVGFGAGGVGFGATGGLSSGVCMVHGHIRFLSISIYRWPAHDRQP